MAKSPSEQIREVAADLRALFERDDTHREVERLTTKVDTLKTELATLRQESAVLRQRVEDHIRLVEEWDRRRWRLIVLPFGTVLSLASGLIATLAKK